MPSGGQRKGAGRPKGSGQHGHELTKAVRLPLSTLQFLEQHEGCQPLPLFISKVSAGFPSPAEDSTVEKLDLNQYLIKHPAATFLVRANGHSMLNAGIHENDILVVDRSLDATDGKVVIAAVDGQLTVKRLKKNHHGQLSLLAENPDYPPILLREENHIHIWGVVTYVIHSL